MQTITVQDKTFRILISAANIAERVAALGKEISTDYQHKTAPPLLIGVLNGAFIFMADLVRAVSIPVEVAFIRYRSYEGMASSGKVQAILPFPDSIAGRDIIIVEDIVDTGITLEALTKEAQALKVQSTRTASLLLKPAKVQTNIKVDYVGFEVSDKFVLGYGMDVDEEARELADIYELHED